jgi:hypothetical protein
VKKKLYLVEAVSMFRMRYVIEAKEESHAMDEHTMEISKETFKEFSQEHIGENISSVRELTKAEYFELFDKDNDYLKSWPKSRKMEYINVIDYDDEKKVP